MPNRGAGGGAEGGVCDLAEPGRGEERRVNRGWLRRKPLAGRVGGAGPQPPFLPLSPPGGWAGVVPPAQGLLTGG